MADNLWLQAIAIVQPAIANEVNMRPYPEVRLLTLAEYAGLIVGAVFWGMSCDVIGRRTAWNATLFVGGVFGVAAGAANNFVTLGALLAMIGFGVGGNLPVDGALFLEFIPGSKQWLLTLLSLWWAVGQVVASLVAWVFLANYGCATPPEGQLCSKESNMGWRYTYYTLGALMLFLWVLRYFVFPMDESPKFLCSIGRDDKAVEVIHHLAKRNGVTSSLTVEDLINAARPYMPPGADAAAAANTKFSTWQLIRHSLDDINGEHTRGLFATKKLAWTTSLIIFCYASLGLGYPLFNAFLGSYLALKNASIGETSLNATYSAYTYQAACGIAGSILAALLVQWSRTGRKYSMAFFTAAAGVFLFGLTQATTPVQVNVLTCFAALFENAFYGVLYAFAPESFPTPHRGTGDAFAAASSRVTGIFAPVIAVYSPARNSPNGPVYASASIFVVTAVVMLFIPVETRGRTAL